MTIPQRRRRWHHNPVLRLLGRYRWTISAALLVALAIFLLAFRGAWCARHQGAWYCHVSRFMYSQGR